MEEISFSPGTGVTVGVDNQKVKDILGPEFFEKYKTEELDPIV